MSQDATGSQPVERHTDWVCPFNVYPSLQATVADAPSNVPSDTVTFALAIDKRPQS